VCSTAVAIESNLAVELNALLQLRVEWIVVVVCVVVLVRVSIGGLDRVSQFNSAAAAYSSFHLTLRYCLAVHYYSSAALLLPLLLLPTQTAGHSHPLTHSTARHSSGPC